MVSPYRQEGNTGKNDANDAAAICEAASRPRMRFIPVKSVEQQSMLCVHRLREGLKEDRTACINRIRGLLLEFGLAFTVGARALQVVLSEVLEDACNELGHLARLTLQRAQAQWRELDEHLAWCDERIAEHGRTKVSVKQAATLIGVGRARRAIDVGEQADFQSRWTRPLPAADWRPLPSSPVARQRHSSPIESIGLRTAAPPSRSTCV